MKKRISILLTLILVFPCFLIVGCGKNKGKEKSFSVNYLQGLYAQVSGAYSLGISTLEVESSKNGVNGVSMFCGNDQISLVKDGKKKKNYIVKSSTKDIGNGKVTTSSSNIEKVKFINKKPKDPNKKGPNGKELEENQEITQDEVDGQVNRLFVSQNFVFIQFVPIDTKNVEDVRDNDLKIKPDGTTDYDASGYYSDDTHKSFIINTETGLIYYIENFYVNKISGLVVMDKEGFLYEISFDENETLKFTQLFTNTNIDVYDFLYADINHTRYVFIRNSVSNYKTTIQSGLNIITYSSGLYRVLKNGEIIFINIDDQTHITEAKKFEGGELVDFENGSEDISLDGVIIQQKYYNRVVSSENSGYFAALHKISNNKLYYSLCIAVEDESSALYSFQINAPLDSLNTYTGYLTNNYNSKRCIPVDFDSIIICNASGQLYQVDNISSGPINEQDGTLILDQSRIVVDVNIYNCYYFSFDYYKVERNTLTGYELYKIKSGEASQIVLEKIEEYNNADAVVVSLQPLNKQ